MAAYTITADSAPVYKQYPWSSSWDCIDWQNWRIALGTKYTADEADYIWSKAWLSGVSCASGGTCDAVGADWVFDSVPLSCRTFDSNFKAFLDTYPNLKSVVFTGIGGLIAKPLSLGTSVVDAAGNVIMDLANTVSNTSSILTWLIPTALIVGAIIAIVYFGRKFNAIPDTRNTNIAIIVILVIAVGVSIYYFGKKKA